MLQYGKVYEQLLVYIGNYIRIYFFIKGSNMGSIKVKVVLDNLVLILADSVGGLWPRLE